MPAEKKESLIEKAEEIVEGVKEKISRGIEKVEETMAEVADELSGKKKSLAKEKKTAKKETSEKEDKLTKLKAKAEKLAKGIKEDTSDLKSKVKTDEEPTNTLAPIEDYLKSSMHLGTRAITPDMKPFVYKRRADSLAVFNTTLLDERVREAGEYLSQFAPEEVLIVCKREAGEKPVRLFSELTGIKAFTKNYPAGILTNPNLDNFIERELMFICDPWTDKSALEDAKRIKMPVLAICDTNNYTLKVDKVLPGNNKSSKSLGFIFYLLAKMYIEKRKLKVDVPPISEWVENWDTLVPPK